MIELTVSYTGVSKWSLHMVEKNKLHMAKQFDNRQWQIPELSMVNMVNNGWTIDHHWLLIIMVDSGEYMVMAQPSIG